MAGEVSGMSVTEPEAIIFFDGVCNLCNASVQRVLKNDKSQYFKMATLQGAFAQNFVLQHAFSGDVDSIILYEKGKFYTYSGAVLRIAGKLRFPYPLLQALFIFPAFIRDPVYRFVARNRYRWFGKRASCMIPEPRWKNVFLDT